MPETPREAPTAGSGLIRSGGVVMVVGMLLTLVATLPLFTGIRLPSYFWGLAMLTGVGFALVLAGLARNARARSRTQRELVGTPASGVGHP